MVKQILIVDANVEFAESIRQKLHADGRFRVHVAPRAAEALQRMQEVDMDLAIVDFRLPDIKGSQLIHQMRVLEPDLPILAIPPKDQMDPEIISELRLDGVLKKPFYAPDLQDWLEEILEMPPIADIDALEAASQIQQSQEESESEPEPIPPWLEEPAAVRKSLQAQLPEAAVHAILLHQGQPLSSVGALSDDQVQTVVQDLQQPSRLPRPGSDIMRYIMLQPEGNNYLMYVACVLAGLHLILLFPAQTPFSLIRKLALLTCQQLLDKPDVKPSIPIEASQVEAATPNRQPPPEAAHPSLSPAAMEEEQKIPLFQDLDLPPPDPQLEPEVQAQSTPIPPPMDLPDDWLPKRPMPASALPFLDAVETGIPSESQADLGQQEVKYHLPFSALLLPRFPDHRLEGELAEHVRQWVHRLCVAWGWRALRITVLPDRMLLTISLSPEVAPATAVFHIARDLSARILGAHPDLAKDLPSKRFWARRYLLTAGEHLGQEQVQSFIESTRQEQGYAT